MATQDVAELGEFTFACGESIPNLKIAYETYGEFDGGGGDSTSDRSAGNAVLVCHALTGSQHVGRRRATPGDAEGAENGDGHSETAGQARAWWGDVVGPGKAIDTTEYYVVCANVPGSCYGSSGPTTPGPDGEPWGTDFPPVTVGDWTRAQRRLLDHLGVGRLHAVVGGSVGGMNALDWGVRYPDDVDRVGAIAAAPRLDAQCLALDTIARRAITTDPNWNGGDYYGDDQPDPDAGLAQARRIGHVMYLSKASMDGKFGRRAAGRGHGREAPDPAAAFFPYRDVESYLDYNAERFVERFDANAYLYLVRAMDDYDAAAGYESDADALGAFDGELLCLSFTGDWHFTTGQSEGLAEAARDADVDVAHHVVDSDHGHDAFLVEPERVGPPIADFLDVGVAGKAVTDTVEESVDEFAPVHTSLFSD